MLVKKARPWSGEGRGSEPLVLPLDGLVVPQFKPYHKLNLDYIFLGLL